MSHKKKCGKPTTPGMYLIKYVDGTCGVDVAEYLSISDGGHLELWCNYMHNVAAHIRLL